MLRALLHTLDNISEWSGKVISFLIYLIMLVVLWEIIARTFFRAPTIWAHELSTFLFGSIAILAGAYVLRHGAHVNVDIISVRLSLRMRAIVDIVTFTLFFLFCGALIWMGAQLFWDSLMLLERTQSSWAPPIYPIKLMVPLGGSLLMLQGLAKFIRDFVTAITGMESI